MAEKTSHAFLQSARVHPGQVVKTYLERLGISVSQASRAVGVSRTNFSQFLNGRFSLSAEMAVRLSRAFDTAPHAWLMLQVEWDIEQAEKKLQDVKVSRLV
ncbi:MAG TPA: HigA family addiction module antitoxin [Oligoflexia bacterium]|nr:HigA family addiction module antitoxin [Oligoflexia bacterium]